MGYVMSNKQQWQQFWKAGSTQNVITEIMLLRVLKRIDFMTLMSALKPLEVQRCGACEWVCGGSRGWGWFLWGNKGLGKAMGALECLWNMAHRCVQQGDVLMYWWSQTLELPQPMLFFRHVSIEEFINQNLLHVNKYCTYGYLFDHSMWKLKKTTRKI